MQLQGQLEWPKEAEALASCAARYNSSSNVVHHRVLAGARKISRGCLSGKV